MVQNNTPSLEDHIKNGWQYISRDISVFEASELFIPRSEYMWHFKTWLCNFAFQYMRWLYFGEWLTDFSDDARTNAINHHRDTILFLLVYTMVYSKYHHYNDVIMGVMASQITNLTIVNSTAYLCTGRIKENIKAPRHWPLWGIHRWPVNSPHKWPVTRKMFPFDDVIMQNMQ